MADTLHVSAIFCRLTIWKEGHAFADAWSEV